MVSGSEQGHEVAIGRVSEVKCPACEHVLDVSALVPFVRTPCPQCGEQVTIPGQLGEYLLLQKLGEGNMGAVYEGLDLTLDRRVAIKVMHATVEDDREFAEQFIREGRALAALNHPNVTQVYTCTKEEGHPYLVMELVSGGSLQDRIREDALLSEAEAIEIAIAIARGLKAAAEIKLAHGDLKPENILFDNNGNPKVVDFGLARFQGEELKTGEIWGTPYYIAPETAQGKQPDPKSDIYCFGATLFHALTGVPPFEGNTATETVLARFRQPVPDIRDQRPELHLATAEVIKRMMEPERFKRYPNYDSLLDDLHSALRRISSEDEPTPKTLPVGRILLASGLLVLGVLGVAFLFFTEKKETAALKRPKRTGTRYVLVDGKIKPLEEKPREEPVAVPDEALSEDVPPEIDRAGPIKITTGDPGGADAYIRGSSDDGNYAGQNFGSEEIIWVKAGADNALHLVRKGYLRFALENVAKRTIRRASLTLTVGKRSSNPRGPAYRLYLWGLKDGHEDELWHEGVGRNPQLKPEINWENAPANDRESGQSMNDRAVLLGELQVQSNPPVGKKIVFGSDKSTTEQRMVQFLQQDTNGYVTFMLTADNETPQQAGWRFASYQHAFLDPPALTLE